MAEERLPDCTEPWNESENAANREEVAREDFDGVRVGNIEWIADFFGALGEGQPASITTEGCGYLFHDDHRYVSFEATWRDGDLEWHPESQSGPWTAEQEAADTDNASLREGGTLGEYAAPEPPVGPEPRAVGSSGGPPPAWLETDRGSAWLGFASFCWGSICVDSTGPVCGGEYTPTIPVTKGELVHAHLDFQPTEATLTYFPGDGSGRRLETRDALVWRVERDGAFSLFVRAKPGSGGSDVSYVGCFDLR